jgi:hypothetical protein
MTGCPSLHMIVLMYMTILCTGLPVLPNGSRREKRCYIHDVHLAARCIHNSMINGHIPITLITPLLYTIQKQRRNAK